MLTTKGKNVLAKYLVNQAPGYAGYIAIGSGANPLSNVSFNAIAAVVANTADVNVNSLTIFTDVANNFQPNDVIFLQGVDNKYDGSYSIASVDPTTNSISANVTIATDLVGTNISASILTSNVATITTSTEHGLTALDKVTITGRTGYNGIYQVASVVNTTAFTYSLVATNIISNTTDGGSVFQHLIPLDSGKVIHNYTNKTSLDFEMFRVPIVSRGIINENNLTNVVFTAELPNLEQYGMTEIGIYPSGSNPTASTIDSKVLFNFSDTENWEYHSDVVEKAASYVDGAGDLNAVINISTNDNFVLINSYDPIFSSYYRMTSKEQPRFESKTLMLRGNSSAINTYLANASLQNVSSSIYSIYENSSIPENQSHIHHTNLSFTFDKNSADDVLKLAFSVITESTGTTQYSEIQGLNMIVQFADSETLGSSEYANMQFSLNSTDLKANNANTQYYVVQKSLSQLKTTPNFQWSAVNTVKIFASAFANVGTNVSASSLTSNIATITTSTAHELNAGDAILITGRTGYNGLYEVASNVNATAFTYSIIASDIGSNTTDGGIVTKLLGNHWIALDGLRFENISSATANPLYGLTGYSLLAETSQSSNGASITNYPVIKQRNTNNFVEFKFALDTGGEI